MKFERLKKSHKKEIIIGGLVVLGIISAITLTTSRAKYRLTQSIPIVRGTINYKPYDLKIMAMYKQKEGSTCTEDSCYDEITGAMPSSGYVVNENKTYCLTSNNEQVKGKIKTVNGTVTLTNLVKNDKCYIWFDKEALSPATTLAKLNIQNYNIVTPTFSRTATTDEGIFRADDGMYGGYSYYWRGAVANNHIIFANMCWRIIRINGDGSIRLIYNGNISAENTCTENRVDNPASIAVSSQPYSGASLRGASYVGWTYTEGKQRPTNNATGTPSNAKAQTETWFTQYITGTNLERVADGKFCNDRSVPSDKTWSSAGGASFSFAAADRLSPDNKEPSPTFGCTKEDVYTLKVGAITADEMVFAGAVYSATTPVVNYYYYLNNGKSSQTQFWTMTPAGPYPSIFAHNNGYIVAGTGTGGIGIRPVISLKANTTFQSGGLGTSNKPYVVAN